MRSRRAFVPVLTASALLALTACGGSNSGPTVAAVLTATPVPESAAPTPTPTPTEILTPSPSPAGPSPVPTAPSPTPTGPAAPTAAVKARFVAAYDPGDAAGLDHVAVDLDLDGIDELLFTFVRDGRTHVDMADWDGRAYRVVSTAEGGPANSVGEVRVFDVNADGRLEVLTAQSSQTGASLTVLTVRSGPRLVGLRAADGCNAGSATYGVVGAHLSDRDGDGIPEIVATCDDSPLPVADWSEDVYHWDGVTYRLFEDEPSPPPSPGDG